jgi:hypothetical protein
MRPDNPGQSPTADEIRDKVVEIIATQTASWESNDNPGHRHYWMGETLADALAEAGLLPTGAEQLAAYAVTDTSDDRLMRRYVSDWREVAG